MTREQLQKRIEELLAGFDNYDLDAVSNMFHENGTANSFTGLQCEGREAVRAYLAPFFAKAMGEMKFDIHQIDIDVDKRAIWTDWTLNLTMNGNTISMPGSDTFIFDKDGMIVYNSVFCKATDALLQLSGQMAQLAAG